MDVGTDRVTSVVGGVVVVVASSEEVVGRDGAAEVELSHRESRGSGGSNRMLLPSSSSANQGFGNQIRVVQGQPLNQTKAIVKIVKVVKVRKVVFFCRFLEKQKKKIYFCGYFLISEKKISNLNS